MKLSAAIFGISKAGTILKYITVIRDMVKINLNNLFIFDKEIFINHDKYN